MKALRPRRMWWPTSFALAGLVAGLLQVAVAPQHYLASATYLLTPCVVPDTCRFSDLLTDAPGLLLATTNETLSNVRLERIEHSLALYDPNLSIEQRLDLMRRDLDIHVLPSQPGDDRRVRFAVTFRYDDGRALSVTRGIALLFEYANVETPEYRDLFPNRIEALDTPEIIQRPPLYSSWYLFPARGAAAGAFAGLLLSIAAALRSRRLRAA